jgi:hypothetical protein
MYAGRVQAQPQPLSILDVPFISQSEALCGGAAAAMVMRYWGERGLDAESFAHLVERTAGGIRTNKLVDDLRTRGWNVTAVRGSDELIDAELGKGRPVITLIEDRPGTFHYVVIVASTPQAVVFHDPARAPFRAMERAPFSRRWAAAERWMAIVVPGAVTPESLPPALVDASEASTCSQLVSAGVQHAQAGDLEAAERSLTSALSCGGATPLRELAGLRLLQRRWPEVTELASAALDEDPKDEYAWQLLATSRFVQNDRYGALEAWNRLGQPTIDVVAVTGLTRTRQRVVEGLLGAPSQTLLTPGVFDRSARRLRELPSAAAARLEFVPRASGVAELRANVVERPLIPTDVWSYGALGLVAVARQEVTLTMGSVTGGGERIVAGWRFWPERPRVSLEIAAPAPWGGLWGVDLVGERQPFTEEAFPASRRTGAGITLSNWISGSIRVSGRTGIARWDRESYAVTAGELRVDTARDRLTVTTEVSGWFGADPFATLTASMRVQSRAENRGLVFIALGGGGVATASTPADVWFAGDTGNVKRTLLRAHPVIHDGMLRSDRLGRRIVHLSGEVRQWWSIRSAVRLGAAAFADAARVSRRVQSDSQADVDLGAGLRLGVPGLNGVFRLDVGKGLRDGATVLSFVYEP